MEFCLFQIIDGGDALWVSQHTLGSENHHGNPGFLFHVVPEGMEEVCGSGGIDNVHITAGGQAEKPFNPRAGVLRPLSLKTMREIKHQSVHCTPFLFCTGNVLVDNHLGHICKVAKLRLPYGESIGCRHGVSIFKAKHSIFVQWRVMDVKGCLVRCVNIFQGEVDLGGVFHYNSGVPVGEGSPYGVLSAEPYRVVL